MTIRRRDWSPDEVDPDDLDYVMRVMSVTADFFEHPRIYPRDVMEFMERVRNGGPFDEDYARSTEAASYEILSALTTIANEYKKAHQALGKIIRKFYATDT